MKTKIKIGLVLSGFLFIQAFSLQAQSFADSLRKDDEEIISSIAPYPEDVRNAILNVSQYTQKLVKIERVQSRSSQSFQDLVADFPRDTQEKFYDLSRYPDLVHQLAGSSYNTFEQVKPMLDHYPKELENTVSGLFPAHSKEIKAMDKTYQASQQAMDKIIESLPTEAQSDFKKVVSMPDVMNLLTEHIDLVVSLGEAYKNDPQGTRQKLNDVSTQINAQNQKDLDEYKQKVASDPQLQEEMKKSSQEFADSYSANDSTYYANQTSTNQNQTSQTPVVNNYYGSGYGYNYYSPYPYPYWFGYPYWYASPIWYPRPLYYYTGFYLGAGGNVMVVGLPSRAYSGWFFRYGYTRYPRYYGFCNNYYISHRTVVNRVNVYGGFHRDVFNHFSRNNRVNMNRPSNFNRGNNMNNPRTNRNGMRNRGSNPAFRNSIRTNGNNFNHQDYSNFRATQFHQQNWQHVGGRGGFGGGGFGGGGHMGGGGRGRH
jgi:hypothetical protein